MGSMITLTAGDGHVLDAYVAEPSGNARASVIIIQEIFGLNEHMKAVTDKFAANGYLSVCPALFDRIEGGVEIPYNDVSKGRELIGKITDDMVEKDINTAADYCRRAGKVGVIGYCWGGAMAFLAACKVNLDCGVSYYGTRITQYSPIMKPKVPFQHHYGEADTSFPMDAVEKVMAEQPEAEHFVYPGAGHGFSCDARPEYNAGATIHAHERTLTFLEAYL